MESRETFPDQDVAFCHRGVARRNLDVNDYITQIADLSISLAIVSSLGLLSVAYLWL